MFGLLGSGLYSITVKDAKGCKSSMEVDVGAANSNLSGAATSTPDSQCEAPHNGTIQVTPAGGTGPYLIKINDGVFGSATSFSGLESGNHTVIIKDATDCEKTVHVNVTHGNTGVGYNAQIKPIFIASCNFSGCHGAGTSGRDWTLFADVKAKASSIKARTANRSMPIGTGPILTDHEIALIGCWVDDGAIEN